jgi:predicted transposase/invertase (TIGR01784 family)
MTKYREFEKLYYEELSDIIVKVKNSLDVWLAFLTRNDLLRTDNLPKILDNPELKKAINVLEVMNFTDAEREAYEEHLKWLRIEANTLKKYGEKARAEGREEGREEGKAELIKIMINKGNSLESIAQMTGLSIEEIQKLI